MDPIAVPLHDECVCRLIDEKSAVITGGKDPDRLRAFTFFGDPVSILCFRLDRPPFVCCLVSCACIISREHLFVNKIGIFLFDLARHFPLFPFLPTERKKEDRRLSPAVLDVFRYSKIAVEETVSLPSAVPVPPGLP